MLGEDRGTFKMGVIFSDSAVPSLTVRLVLLASLLMLLTYGHPTLAADSSTEIGAQRDYCLFESFNATCPRDSIILMKTARYGRMRVGRCVRGDYGYIGCAASVLRNLDQHCSGRADCRVDIPALEEVAKPCPTDFKSYLEASYECVQVASGSAKECRESHSISLTTNSYGYVASFITEETGFGSASCPWTIKVSGGQKIRLRFYNFLPVTTESIDPRYDESAIGCPLFAVVKEGGKTVDLNLCDQTEREGSLYTSDGDEIQLYFSSQFTGRVPKFMIQYKAIGCADINLSKSALVKRTGDNAMIKCNQTQETWYVTCKDNKWIGDIGNCTKGAQGWRTGGLLSSTQSVPHSIVIAVVIGILLGVVIGTILLAVVFTCRRRQRMLAQEKRDPLSSLNKAERGPRGSDVDHNKDGYKFSRENNKNPDYSYRQQSRPLITRLEAECKQNDSNPCQQNTSSRVVDPPPYCPSWGTADGGGALGHSSHVHEYESPKITRCPRDSLPVSPVLRDPPVYFELEGKNNAASPGSAGVGTHGSLSALGVDKDDDVEELH